MRFRKSYFVALAISFAVFCGAGIISLFIAGAIPSSPLAQQFKYLQENHYSAAAYTSTHYAIIAQQVAALDFWITLSVMAIAGVAFGLKMAARVQLLQTIGYSVISALVFGGGTLSLARAGTVAVEKASVNSTGYGPNTQTDKHYLFIAAGTVVLWAIVYTIGAIAGHIARRRLAPPSVPPKSHKPSKGRVASTTP